MVTLLNDVELIVPVRYQSLPVSGFVMYIPEEYVRETEVSPEEPLLYCTSATFSTCGAFTSIFTFTVLPQPRVCLSLSQARTRRDISFSARVVFSAIFIVGTRSFQLLVPVAVMYQSVSSSI